ncbi:hypothetical protein E3N88_34868 [Mikania micrantha]|uniref:Uncharacterized protein n=1 Tax=Mikania micrantha TaxID=192012 RepID=A0A5N6LZI0_9ASTR|nr:hypothetical protein E3N88_34868 [Mikania micrantha]
MLAGGAVAATTFGVHHQTSHGHGACNIMGSMGHHSEVCYRKWAYHPVIYYNDYADYALEMGIIKELRYKCTNLIVPA